MREHRSAVAVLPAIRVQIAADELAAIAEDLIAERRQRNAEGDDLLGLLLALRDEDGSAFTDDEVRDEALTLILSGHETTANAWTGACS